MRSFHIILFFRRRAPRLPGPRRRWRAGRGAPRPANPYSFVTGHHVFRVQGAGVGVARRWNMASRGARRQHGRLWGETNLRLGAKETEDQGLAGIRAPSPWRPRAKTGLRLGAKGTEDQGLAGIRAPSPWRPRAENGLRLGAKGTKEQGFAGIRAPSPRRPHVKTGPRLGAKETEDQGFAMSQAPTWPAPRREIPFFHF